MTELPPQLAAALAGRYLIERELGRGGNATVYLAHDPKHNRKVALKVLLPDLAQGVGSERFLREISIAANLNHPHILALLDSGTVEGMLYYVMPYVEGESVRERLQREKQLPLEDALRITREVAEALTYAHSNGVVHRDIKPENILLQAGRAVVADFGIARALTVAGGQAVTQSGVAVGTPAYMSPEQAGGSGVVDGRSDIYSLGCVLYEMLTGHPPFTGATAQETLARHALDPVPTVRAGRESVPEAVERAVRKALAKQPVDRFATAAQFTAALSASSAGGRPRRQTWVYAGLALLVLLGGGAVISRVFRRAAAAPPPEKSIAILPFVNLSADSSQEYFSDGMAEELINAFSRIEGLRVPGRTSSFAFKGKTVPYRQIGAELNVSTVLEGSVRRSGDVLRVSVRLVNVADGYQLWTERYDRKVTDVFAVQDEISRAIVKALQVTLVAGEDRALSARSTENLEAYQLYLKGRLFWNRGTEEGLNRAREFFSAAIAQDPGYARAYAGLADAYERLLILRYLPRAEAYPKARAAAERAVALDSQLAEAYASRGAIRHRHEWDWSGAERDLRRAVALNPGYALGHVSYGLFLAQQNRRAEAIREARRAAELDPLSSQVVLNYGLVLYYAHQYDPAAEAARKALELEPSAEGHQRLGEIYVRQGKFPAAIREYQAALNRLAGRGRVATNLARLGYAYARAGRRAEALRTLEELTARGAAGDSALIGYAYNLAILYVGLSEQDQAFAWLDRAYREHDYALTGLRIAPFFDPLRSDPRFKRLLKNVGLEE